MYCTRDENGVVMHFYLYVSAHKAKAGYQNMRRWLYKGTKDRKLIQKYNGTNEQHKLGKTLHKMQQVNKDRRETMRHAPPIYICYLIAEYIFVRTTYYSKSQVLLLFLKINIAKRIKFLNGKNLLEYYKKKLQTSSACYS